MIALARLRSGSFQVTDRQRSVVRGICIAIAVVQLGGAIGLYRQVDWAIKGWPLPDVRMTYIFMASISAAIAAPCGWIAWRKEMGALQPMSLQLMTGIPAVGLYLLWLALERRDRALAIAAIAAFVAGAFWAALYWWSRRVPLRDARPLPTVYRASFAGFCVILVAVGAALLLQVEHVFPWAISPETSTLIGIVFLSAALLFGWVVANPEWSYGEMSLSGFLAYDLVLALPYLDLWQNRNDVLAVASYYGDMSFSNAAIDNGVNETSLAIFLAVLAVSAILAVAMFVWGSRWRPGIPRRKARAGG